MRVRLHSPVSAYTGKCDILLSRQSLVNRTNMRPPSRFAFEKVSQDNQRWMRRQQAKAGCRLSCWCSGELLLDRYIISFFLCGLAKCSRQRPECAVCSSKVKVAAELQN